MAVHLTGYLLIRLHERMKPQTYHRYIPPIFILIFVTLMWEIEYEESRVCVREKDIRKCKI